MHEAIKNMLSELDREAVATRRLLERVPGDKLNWAPHTKSMTLGQLARHVATIPARISGMMLEEGFDTANANFQPPKVDSTEELLQAFDESLGAARKNLGSLDPAKADVPWTMSRDGKEIFTMPRFAVGRTLLLNHWYHHRGQLTVYLRLLDVLLPATYGRSADESTFG